MRSPILIVLALDELSAGHAAIAIRRHRSWIRDQRLAEPPGLSDIERAFVAANGHERSVPDVAADRRHHGVMEPVLLTSREAAAALRCGERTLRRLVASGGLPYVQVGGRRRYRPGDIAEFVESRRPGGA